MQLRQAFVGNLAVDQRSWDDSDHFAARVQGSVGDRGHGTDAGTTVDQRNAAASQTAAELVGHLAVDSA